MLSDNNIRVNVIGFKKKNTYNESNILISRSSLSEKFSINKDNTQYRIEFYKNNRFCSMTVVHFNIGVGK